MLSLDMVEALERTALGAAWRWRASVALAVAVAAVGALIFLHWEQSQLLLSAAASMDAAPTSPAALEAGREALDDAIRRQDLAFHLALGGLAALAVLLASIAAVTAWQRRHLVQELGAVQTSERRLAHLVRAITTGTTDAVYVKDRQGRYLFLNDAATAIVGKPAAQLLGEDDTTLFPPETARMLMTRDAQLMAAGDPVLEEEDGVVSRGEPRTFLSMKAPYRDEDGAVVGLIGISRDITERKRDEQALRKERDRIHRLLEVSTSVVCAFRRAADGRITFPYASPHVVELYDRTPDELAVDATDAMAMTHPDDFARVNESIEVSARELSLWHQTFRIVHPRRGVIHVEARSQPSGGSDGSVTWDGVMTDVTGLEALRGEVRAHHQMLRDAGALAKVGGWYVDLVTGRGRWTEETTRIVGAPSPEGDAKSQGLGLFDGEHRDRATEAFERAARDGTPYDIELVREMPDGTERWVHAMGRPEIVDGKVVAITGAIQDVTDRRAIEERLRRFNVELEERVAERTAQLEEANLELESFGYSISHDLRAPLRAIHSLGVATIEDHGPALPSAARENLDIVLHSTERMARLIDSLLAFSRLGRETVRRGEVDHGALVRACLAELSPDPSVRVDVGELPTTTGDAALLRQVWSNLLSNALKYAGKRAEPLLEVRSEICPKRGTILSVRDNGAGFDMRYADKLFRVFSRLHREDEFHGTGVGLAIVHRIVKRHGGDVWAEARPDHGATFRFTVEPPPGTAEPR